MTAQVLCPLCGEGHVTAQVEHIENHYKGQTALLPQHFKQCDHCGSDFAGAPETRLTKRALMAWRKQVDGLLTGAEITALRKQYGLTQTQAAQLFGGGPVAFSKYENDDVAQSEAMDTLLRLVRRSPEAFRALQAEKGMAVADAAAVVLDPVPVRLQRLVRVQHYRIESSCAEPTAVYERRAFRRFKPSEVSPWKN